ncbi:hypothetical protein [Neobacillus sp. CF12]|uniref:hypothetical protein n=1 Tax=Neobacillus sp. CF12 TaxID=3055864 RepID=UPI0025A12F5A|nr:hypothetical protein [Neobacillus sp. CF12]MDM5326182.1 hypothetical protein [Neobacillus sp. CF12]
METNNFKVVPEKLVGKTVEEVAIANNAVVIKFTDGTFFDIYSSQTLKTSTNNLEG